LKIDNKSACNCNYRSERASFTR